MTYELPEDQIPVFNKHFEEGNKLSNELIILKGDAPIKIGFWKKRKVNKAINHYKRCIELIPNHWQSKWLIAKLYQTLKEHESALQYFQEAMAIEKSNPDVAREASISAMDAGKIDLAVKYSLEAVNREPENAGLICNHAINLMISGKDNDALNWIEKACESNPEDLINQNAHSLILDVKNGNRRRPKYNEIN